METAREIEPGGPEGAERGSPEGWWSELVTENAMMDEATRYVRQFLRTGGGDAGKGANIVILAILGLFYLWFLAMMIRYDLTLTIPIEYAQLGLVTLIAPTSIYAAISGEREKATWDALVLTRLTPAQIIAGKLAWRVLLVAVVMLILMVSIVVSQFTSDDVWDRPTWAAVFTGQAMIFAWGVMLCAASLWVSACTKQSVTTIALVIGSLLGGLILLPSLLAMFGADMAYRYSAGPLKSLSFVLWLNPFLFLGRLTGEKVAPHSDLPPSGEPFTWALFLILVFSLAAAGFVYAAQARIKRLEEPVRNS